jgi:hypothetical protein
MMMMMIMIIIIIIIIISIVFFFPLGHVRAFGGFQFTVNSLNKPQILDCQCAFSIEARHLVKLIPYGRTQHRKLQTDLRLQGEIYNRY